MFLCVIVHRRAGAFLCARAQTSKSFVRVIVHGPAGAFLSVLVHRRVGVFLCVLVHLPPKQGLCLDIAMLNQTCMHVTIVRVY